MADDLALEDLATPLQALSFTPVAFLLCARQRKYDVSIAIFRRTHIDDYRVTDPIILDVLRPWRSICAEG